MPNSKAAAGGGRRIAKSGGTGKSVRSRAVVSVRRVDAE